MGNRSLNNGMGYSCWPLWRKWCASWWSDIWKHRKYSVPYADRSDYYNRWVQELDRLDKEVESQREYWERSNLDLGASAILVHGGMYGNGAMGMGNAQIAAMQRGWIQSGLFQPIFMMYNPNE